MLNKFNDLTEQGYCVLKGCLDIKLVEACGNAFWPVLLNHVHNHEPNRGLNRHFIPMPFDYPCFVPEFFFNEEVLGIVRQAMGEKIVIDQWGCDIPLQGSAYQGIHVDYQRPLFAEAPDLLLPTYMLVVSFGLVPVVPENGAIEIAPGTHRMPRKKALPAADAGKISMQPVSLELGDVLVRHPWTLHRGTPNVTDIPRPLVSIRYVRHWYADNSRDVNSIPQTVWASLTTEQRNRMRFAVQG